jgi:hypothetical protein
MSSSSGPPRCAGDLFRCGCDPALSRADALGAIRAGRCRRLAAKRHQKEQFQPIRTRPPYDYVAALGRNLNLPRALYAVVVDLKKGRCVGTNRQRPKSEGGTLRVWLSPPPMPPHVETLLVEGTMGDVAPRRSGPASRRCTAPKRRIVMGIEARRFLRTAPPRTSARGDWAGNKALHLVVPA